jgi:hypothetical protein
MSTFVIDGYLFKTIYNKVYFDWEQEKRPSVSFAIKPRA